MKYILLISICIICFIICFWINMAIQERKMMSGLQAQWIEEEPKSGGQ